MYSLLFFTETVRFFKRGIILSDYKRHIPDDGNLNTRRLRILKYRVVG